MTLPRVLAMNAIFGGLSGAAMEAKREERQLTTWLHGHVLTNVNVWSPHLQWIVYDVRTAGRFNGTYIDQVNARTGEVQRLDESRDEANCGVVTYSPAGPWVVFIPGPAHPTADWSYGFTHRRGLLVETNSAGLGRPLDGGSTARGRRETRIYRPAFDRTKTQNPTLNH